MNTLIEKVLYIPPECCYNPDNFGNPYRYLEVDDLHGGKIPLMHVKSPFEAQFHIVYSHANAEDISQLKGFCRWLSRSLSSDLYTYDYPGYGLNNGKTTEDGIKESGLLVVEYLIDTLHIDPNRIVLFGHSLGSATTVYMAVNLFEKRGISVGGIILQSCFMSIYRVALNWRMTFRKDLFPTIDIISNIKCPVCLIHGTDDTIVPLNHAKEIFLKIPEQYRYKCLFVEGAGHNSIELSCNPRTLYSDFISDFLKYIDCIQNKSV